MIVREHSYREVRKVLTLPEVAPYLGTADNIPVSDRVLYLRCGRGYMIYVMDGEQAFVHAALLPGDFASHFNDVLEQFAYVFSLGVKRLIGRIRATHVRCQRAAERVGFRFCEQQGPFHIYEVCHG